MKFKLLYITDEIKISLPETGPIGISCSGGADSSVLLYILLKNHNDKIFVLTCANSEKNYSSSITTTKVINKCIDLTGNNNVSHYTWYTNKQDINTLFANQFKLLNEGTINILYTGITANPPDHITSSFSCESTEYSYRNPNIKRNIWDENQNIHMPFTNSNKQEINLIYKKYDLIDSLFPITRSCESIDTQYINQHCGICWWCQERQWAFGRLK